MVLQRIFVDADVLAARTPYEWLVLLRDETGGSFQLHSSADVVEDAVRRWVRRDPVAREPVSAQQLDLLATSLDEVVMFDEVTPQRDDRRSTPLHDAVTTGAHVLLSSAERDLADEDLLPFEIYTADQFLCLVDDSAAPAVRNVAVQQEHRARRQAEGGALEPLTAALADALADAGCRAFAERVASHLRDRGH